VLVGCVAAAHLPPAQPPPTVAQSPMVVDDFGEEWLDYDGIVDVGYYGMFQEEFGTPCQRYIPQPVVTQPRLSRPVAINTGPPPPMAPDGRPEEWGEMSEYELYRERNIQECRAQWLEVFGEEWPCADKNIDGFE
jgi:hypothetical protein